MGHSDDFLTMTPQEIVIIQHRLTERTVLVDRTQYLRGARSRYRNFRLKGQGRFISPPPLDWQKSLSADHQKREA